MSADDSTAPVEFRELSGYLGYRFRSDGGIDSRWEGGGNGVRLTADRWHPIHIHRSPGRRHPTAWLKKDGKRLKVEVHRLFAEAFCGPCPPGMECRHKDDDPLNNRADNLMWGTRLENMADRRRNGIQIQGEGQWRALLTEDKVREFRRRYAAGGVSYQQLADEVGVSFHTVRMAVLGKSWKHVV